MHFITPFLSFALFTASSLCSQSAPIPPRQDPWYKAPAGFESASPGQILKVRNAPGNLTAIYTNATSAYNILFRTTDSNYQPSWAVTTLFVPLKASKRSSEAKEDLVSYQIPYNTADVNSSPSSALYDPSFWQTIIGSDIEALLGRGWYTNVPDFEGPTACFLCGVQEGHAVLDSIRAVQSWRNSSSEPTFSRVALWGYSGGSVASEFATELQVQYAPELKIDGAALGGTVPNATSVLPLADGSQFAGLVPVAFTGLSSEHPELKQALYSHLKQSGPYNATTFLSVRNMSIDQAFAFFANQTFGKYFTDGDAFYSNPALISTLDRDSTQSYHGIPAMPLFIYKAIGDELAPVNDTDELVDRYCKVGANILYQKNTIGGHVAEETNGDAGALEWLGSILAGTYNHTGCTTQVVAINVTDSPA